MTSKIKKAVIPVAGLGTRFLPLSKLFPKEMLPLAGKPIIQHIIEEMRASGIKEVIFVNRPGKNDFLNYLKEDKEIKKFLAQRKRTHLLKEIEILNRLPKEINFSQVYQKVQLGDGHAVLQAEKKMKNEPCIIAWADDVVESKTPCALQMIKAFNKLKSPILGLVKVPKESFPNYGMVKAKKIGSRVYRIEKIVEKPSIKQSPSNLAIIGRYILTPEIIKDLKNKKRNDKGEISLTETFGECLDKGKPVYGYEIKGKWLECGNKSDYLKSNFYLALKDPKMKKELKKLLKTDAKGKE